MRTLLFPSGSSANPTPARAPARVGVGRGTQDSKSFWVYRIFFLRKCFIVTGGRVDGLTGGRVDGLTGGRVDGWTVNKKVL